jgi:1,4-dihydroxy-2-naphthoyl-CoA hydrolase
MLSYMVGCELRECRCNGSVRGDVGGVSVGWDGTNEQGQPNDVSVRPDGRYSERLQQLCRGTLMEALGIVFTALDPSRVCATMAIGPSTRQPAGLLHGGASVALAESVASMGAYVSLDGPGETAVGVEINANHIRAVRSGVVTATATPLHKGNTTQVWDVRITDERERLVCISRCTIAVRRQAGNRL